MIDRQNEATEIDRELPVPIQLTPDQINDVAGGCSCATVIIRVGLPRAVAE